MYAVNITLKTVQCLKQLEVFIKCTVYKRNLTTKATKPDDVYYKVIGILSSKGISGGSYVFPLAAVAMLGFSQPFVN